MRAYFKSEGKAACKALLAAGVGLIGSAGWLHAGVVQVGSSAALGANDSVVWGQLGPVNTILPNSNNFTSTSGLTGNVMDGTTGGVPQLRNAALYNLTTNPVYDNQYDNNVVTITFNSAVSGVGVLMMNDFGSGASFSYHMQVFNSGGSLGTFNVASPQVSNTPSYLGVLDSIAEITKVSFTTDAFSGNSGDYYALDTLNLKDNVGQTQVPGVPEPGSLALAGIGLILLAGAIRRARA